MPHMLPRYGELESRKINPDAAIQFQVRCVHLLHPQIHLLGRGEEFKWIQLSPSLRQEVHGLSGILFLYSIIECHVVVADISKSLLTAR